MLMMKPILSAMFLGSLHQSKAWAKPAVSRILSMGMRSSKRDSSIVTAPLQSPFGLTNFFDDFDALFPMLRHDLPSASHALAMDFKDTKDAYELALDAPGFKKEQIHLEVHKNRLTITADRSHEEKKEEGGRIIREERRNYVSRTIPIPEDVDKEKIDAHFENGVLKLVLPRDPEHAHKETRKIELK